VSTIPSAVRAASLQAELRDMHTAGMRLRGQVELLKRALEKYGWHTVDCARRQLHVCADGSETVPSAVLADAECTCGLDKIVTPGDEPRIIAPK
jgi:hypothetical protein